jgi:vacuolar-type H+-ATPase subunit H
MSKKNFEKDLKQFIDTVEEKKENLIKKAVKKAFKEYKKAYKLLAKE